MKNCRSHRKNSVYPIPTQYCILTHLRYIAVENIVRKKEIACNKQFLLFTQCFLPYVVLSFHFKCTLKCCLQFVSIWTSLKFCRLVIGYTDEPVIENICNSFFVCHQSPFVHCTVDTSFSVGCSWNSVEMFAFMIPWLCVKLSHLMSKVWSSGQI